MALKAGWAGEDWHCSQFNKVNIHRAAIAWRWIQSSVTYANFDKRTARNVSWELSYKKHHCSFGWCILSEGKWNYLFIKHPQHAGSPEPKECRTVDFRFYDSLRLDSCVQIHRHLYIHYTWRDGVHLWGAWVVQQLLAWNTLAVNQGRGDHQWLCWGSVSLFNLCSYCIVCFPARIIKDSLLCLIFKRTGKSFGGFTLC